MIQLTRLNNKPLVINSDLIKFVETAHDTVITLLTGEKIVVVESSDVVVERVVAFRRRIQQQADAACDAVQALQVAQRVLGDASSS